MKQYFFYSSFVVLLLACNSNNTDTVKDIDSSSAAAAPSANEAPAESKRGEGILGDWKLQHEAYDNNSNGALDADERSKAIKNHYFYRFNENGSALIGASSSPAGAFKGRYEKKTENGKEKLYEYRDKIPGEDETDPVPEVYTIISVSGEELVLLESLGNNTFWIFKR